MVKAQWLAHMIRYTETHAGNASLNQACIISQSFLSSSPSFHVFSTITIKSVLPAAIEKFATGIDDAVLLSYYRPFFQIISKYLFILTTSQHNISSVQVQRSLDVTFLPPRTLVSRSRQEVMPIHIFQLVFHSQWTSRN